MARFDCNNIGRNFPSLMRLQRQRFIQSLPTAEPKAEDLELAARWLRERPQADLDEAEEFWVDPIGEFLTFAAQQRSSVTAEESSRLRQAYRKTIRQQFTEASRSCSLRVEQAGGS